MFPRYLQYLLTDFRQTFVTGASRERDEPVRFWGQKVKVQGHGMTECVPDFHVSTIYLVSIDRFSPSFCHWCILGHRWPYYVFGSKVQSSRSHHRGGGAQHLTLPLTATFSSLSLKLREPCLYIVVNDDYCDVMVIPVMSYVLSVSVKIRLVHGPESFHLALCRFKCSPQPLPQSLFRQLRPRPRPP